MRRDFRSFLSPILTCQDEAKDNSKSPHSGSYYGPVLVSLLARITCDVSSRRAPGAGKCAPFILSLIGPNEKLESRADDGPASE